MAIATRLGKMTEIIDLLAYHEHVLEVMSFDSNIEETDWDVSEEVQQGATLDLTSVLATTRQYVAVPSTSLPKRTYGDDLFTNDSVSADSAVSIEGYSFVCVYLLGVSPNVVCCVCCVCCTCALSCVCGKSGKENFATFLTFCTGKIVCWKRKILWRISRHWPLQQGLEQCGSSILLLCNRS